MYARRERRRDPTIDPTIGRLRFGESCLRVACVDDGPADSRVAFWDHFYAADAMAAVPDGPTGFARYVAHNFRDVGLLVELGCGSGRDALWFGRSTRFRVIATDASLVAISRLRGQIPSDRLTVARVDLNCTESLNELLDTVEGLRSDESVGERAMVYGRFLLHAIDEPAQRALLEFASKVLRPGDVLALEYRARKLNSGQYVFGDHYRRPVVPADFANACYSAGFSYVKTAVSDEFAVLGAERPLIGRTIAIR